MELSKFYKIRQIFDDQHIKEVDKELNSCLKEVKVEEIFSPGEKVAIAVGSRGIANITLLVKTLVERLKELGVDPFIIPAMGSHGGATALGQLEVLNKLGISEEKMGAPIISDMEVVKLGKTPSGAFVYMDKTAWSADAVIVINRIKPHTRFKAANESGLMKMVAVGLGKEKGCTELHKNGLYPNVVEAARIALNKSPIRLGIGIVENAYDQTFKIAAVRKENFEAVDAELLKLAKAKMPSLPVDDIDLLVVKEIGKNISGTGMDVNILGRVKQPILNEYEIPRIKSIAAMDLTPETNGNALGMGLADVITKKFADKIDFKATYANVIAAGFLSRGRMPVVQDNDREAIMTALKCIERLEPLNARIVFIKNTLELEYLTVSETIYNELNKKSTIEVVQEYLDLTFDAKGNLEKGWW
ncbi:MAG: hypothetical protein PWP71_532 [Clostridia bacterium]|jgi:hypothetical protein|nr:hypothetical protein [Clostridia bacterium]